VIIPPVKMVTPKPKMSEETPEGYLERLIESVSKAEVASVLASRYDSTPFV